MKRSFFLFPLLVTAITILSTSSIARPAPPISQPPTPVVSDPEIALANRIAKQIQEAAKPSTEKPGVVVLDGSVFITIILATLPKGAYAEPGTARDAELSGKSGMDATHYVLPDGRHCLVFDTKNPHPNLEHRGAFTFRYRHAPHDWGTATVPIHLPTTNSHQLAAQIMKEAVAPPKPPARIFATYAPHEFEVMAALWDAGVGEGTRLLGPVKDEDHTDATGKPLPAIDFIFKDGRRCRVIDVAGNVPRSAYFPRANIKKQSLAEGAQDLSDPVLLARQIATGARYGDIGSVIIASKAAAPETVIPNLPTGGSHAPYPYPEKVENSPGFQVSKATQYTLPDGRTCVVLTITPVSP